MNDDVISLEFYLFLLENGIPYEGLVRDENGVIFRSICEQVPVPPEFLYIANPPRFVDYVHDTVSLITKSTLCYFPEDNSIKVSDLLDRITEHVIRKNSDGTATVDFGKGNLMTVPTDNSVIQIDVNEHSFTIRAQDNSTGTVRTQTINLEDIQYFYEYADSNILKRTISITGFATSASELGAGKSTFRITRMNGTKFSPKLYRRSPNSVKKPYYGGGKGNIKTYNAAKALKWTSRSLFIVGAVVEFFDVFQKEQTYETYKKALVNIAFGSIATWGGPVGLVIGIAYFGLDALGILDEPYFTKMEFNPEVDLFPQTFCRADKTRIVLPHISPELINNVDGLNTSHLDSTSFQRLLLDE
jgi:hypothetical protein